MTRSSAHRFVICIRNDDYPASLETRKIYEVLSDPGASNVVWTGSLPPDPGDEKILAQAHRDPHFGDAG